MSLITLLYHGHFRTLLYELFFFSQLLRSKKKIIFYAKKGDCCTTLTIFPPLSQRVIKLIKRIDQKKKNISDPHPVGNSEKDGEFSLPGSLGCSAEVSQ